MSLYKQFETEENLEKTGVRITYGLNAKGKEIAILVGRAGGKNEAFQRVADAVYKPFRRQIQNETIDRVKMRELTYIIYARAVVKGWENVDDKDGNPMEFNEANVVKLFNDLPALFDDVQGTADSLTVYRTEALELEAKN